MVRSPIRFLLELNVGARAAQDLMNDGVGGRQLVVGLFATKPFNKSQNSIFQVGGLLVSLVGYASGLSLEPKNASKKGGESDFVHK